MSECIVCKTNILNDDKNEKLICIKCVGEGWGFCKVCEKPFKRTNELANSLQLTLPKVITNNQKVSYNTNKYNIEVYNRNEVCSQECYDKSVRIELDMIDNVVLMEKVLFQDNIKDLKSK